MDQIIDVLGGGGIATLLFALFIIICIYNIRNAITIIIVIGGKRISTMRARRTRATSNIF